LFIYLFIYSPRAFTAAPSIPGQQDSVGGPKATGLPSAAEATSLSSHGGSPDDLGSTASTGATDTTKIPG